MCVICETFILTIRIKSRKSYVLIISEKKNFKKIIILVGQTFLGTMEKWIQCNL